MADFKLTPGQQAAVETRGAALLVSAAAGSGKTKVLVDRLTSYVTDPDDPKDIDSFLIITYTRAAAAELRARILSRLGQLCAENPSNRRLRRQSDLCCRAQIGTIHSFCTAVLRENNHLTGLSPDFKVADEDRCSVMKQRIMERLLDSRYEELDAHPGFASLSDTVGAGRDDARLNRVSLSLYEKMQSFASPDMWAQAQILAMDTAGKSDIGDTVWGRELLRSAQDSAAYWLGVIESLIQRLHEGGEAVSAIAKSYAPSLADTATSLRAFTAACGDGWDKAASALPIEFPRLGSLRKSPDAQLSDFIKDRRSACKKAAVSLGKYFDGTSSELLADMEATRPAMTALLELVTDFGKAYSAEKRRCGLVDFSDLEHLTASLLTDGEKRPTPLAREISKRYTEIMCDEYQDVNEVQDLILSSVSKGGYNLFMVGDVKQSIYRFRLADPGIFIDRYLKSADFDKAEDGAPKRVLLRENFRSSSSVLNAANLVFDNIMSTQLGEIDYDDSARLRCGSPAQEKGAQPAELFVVDTSCAEENEEKTDVEARFVSEKIKLLVGSGALISDGDARRPVTYGDVVILLRSPGSAAISYRRALAALGIPVASEQSSGFFDSLEISIALSMLEIIDNPHQDVPLISVLRSPVFGFTPDELSQIRLCSPDTDFYSALLQAGDGSGKCADFIAELSSLRALAPDMPLDRFLWHIYSRTDLLALCSAMPDGASKRENLLLLFRCAGEFEASGCRGLFLFIEWLHRLMERGDEPHSAPAAAGNAVTIMSIHKSKGLEFPVVFLCDTSRQFNRSDLAQPVLMHARLGLGPKLTDAARGVEYPTAARRAIASVLHREMLSEEMRVLYVAMTRAKQRLFVTCAEKDPQKTLAKLRPALASPLPHQVLSFALAPSQWLIMSSMLDTEGKTFPMSIVQPEGSDVCAPPAGKAEDAFAESEEFSSLCEKLDFVYPFAAACPLPSKITATEIKSLLAAEIAGDAERSVAPQSAPPLEFRLPDFSDEERPATAAERGTALHLIMQRIEPENGSSPDAVRDKIESLASLGFLSRRQADSINPDAVVRFFRSELGRRVVNSDNLMREARFSLLVPAGTYFKGGCEDEEILLQGVVDCCFEERGELVIIDYKSDYVNNDTLSSKASFYAPQLATYARAMERITGKPVKQCLLYFLGAGLQVEVGRELF